jgi:hypothetical protein
MNENGVEYYQVSATVRNVYHEINFTKILQIMVLFKLNI